MRPFQSSFTVVGAGDKLDGWKGASYWGEQEGNREWFVTREEYQERGGEYFKEHAASNPYLTPLPLPPS